MSKIDLILQESEKAFIQERIRADKLWGASEKLIGAVAVIMGFHLIEIDRLTLTGNWRQVAQGWLAICAIVALMLALFLALLSMQVQKYYSYPRGTTLIDDLKDDSITDQAAMIKIARMYLKAHDNNARINDKRARLVFYSLIMLVTGLLFAVFSYFLGIVL